MPFPMQNTLLSPTVRSSILFHFYVIAFSSSCTVSLHRLTSPLIHILLQVARCPKLNNQVWWDYFAVEKTCISSHNRMGTNSAHLKFSWSLLSLLIDNKDYLLKYFVVSVHLTCSTTLLSILKYDMTMWISVYISLDVCSLKIYL